MKMFKVESYQVESGQWVPSCRFFEASLGDTLTLSENSEFPPEQQFRFDSEEDANNFIRSHFVNLGYVENLI